MQIWVYGNSFEATLVAVAVPNQPALEKWAQTNGVEGDFSQLCKDPKAKEFILSELGATGKMKKVSFLFKQNYGHLFTSEITQG